MTQEEIPDESDRDDSEMIQTKVRKESGKVRKESEKIPVLSVQERDIMREEVRKKEREGVLKNLFSF